MADTLHAASLPEAKRAALDAKAVTRAIAHHPAMLVRELITPDDASALDSAFHKAIAAAESGVESEWYRPYDDGTSTLAGTRAWVRDIDCALMADSPAMIASVLDIYRRNGIIDLITEHLGERPVLSSQKSTLRRTRTNKIYTDNYHQDGAFLGGGIKVLNVWLALTPCGERAASVEIGATRQSGVVQTGGDGALFDWSVSPRQAALASPATVTPICAPGDALLFDHLCLHRTSINPAYDQDRRALETWFFAPSTYPRDFDPRPITV